MIATPYKMSFTTGGLFIFESVLLAESYTKIKNWKTVRVKALDENQLQVRTQSSAIRMTKEIIARLETLHRDELNLLTEGSFHDHQHILWLAVCRRFEYISDFAKEVLRERYISLQQDLNFTDYDYFFSKKAETHVELEQLKPTTQKKLRQVLFRMLREAEYLSKDYKITPTIISPELRDLLINNGKLELAIYPINDVEAKY